MRRIVVTVGTRSVLRREEILALLSQAASAIENEREHIIAQFLEHCVFRDAEKSLFARDAMRFFFWYMLEQYNLGRIAEEKFVATTYPVFVRFCESAPRESTAEDIKIARLMNAALYSTDRDPLARTLRII